MGGERCTRGLRTCAAPVDLNGSEMQALFSQNSDLNEARLIGEGADPLTGNIAASFQQQRRGAGNHGASPSLFCSAHWSKSEVPASGILRLTRTAVGNEIRGSDEKLI